MFARRYVERRASRHSRTAITEVHPFELTTTNTLNPIGSELILIIQSYVDRVRLETMALGQNPNVVGSCCRQVDFVIQTGAGSQTGRIRIWGNGSAVVRQELHGFCSLSINERPHMAICSSTNISTT
ncbi:hypothetical protein D3C71_1443370 [compost metagenome]